MHPLVYQVSCRVFLAKHQITQVTQPPYSPDLVPCVLRLFPKLKSPLKGKRFQNIDEIQGNMMGSWWQLGKLWGPKVPTLKGTKASLSYVQCFLCLVSSSINLFFFFFNIFYLFIERGREDERERNINVWLPLTRPLLGTWPDETQGRCPRPGIELVTPPFIGWHSIHWATPFRAKCPYCS